MSFPLQLQESDLNHIGRSRTKNKNNDGTLFILNNFSEAIILRSLIKSLGYKSSEPKEINYILGKSAISIKTNYPWNKYIELGDDFEYMTDSEDGDNNVKWKDDKKEIDNRDVKSNSYLGVIILTENFMEL